MNIAISKIYSQTSDAEKGKIKTRLDISFLLESTVDSEMTKMNKDDFILVTCRNMPSVGNSKKKNYTIQTKHFETGTTDDVLHTYVGT